MVTPRGAALLLLLLAEQLVGGFLAAAPSMRRGTVLRSTPDDDADALLARAAELRRDAEALEATLPPPVVEEEPPTVEGPPESVVRQVVNAFDNLPPAESTEAARRAWTAGGDAKDKLAQLAAQADDVEDAFFNKQTISSENAADSIRVLRSRIRMEAKAFLPRR
mmetsp:Transcript_16958/g.51434  ORF Transcript_16958/g.51434 Transcript_16958/m.51434 type:complete len:165 (-) Transcript_16958:71-565(-)